jgi:hypothetical protein
MSAELQETRETAPCLTPEIGPRLSSHYDAVPTRFKETRFLVCGKYIAIYDYETPLVKVIELYHGSQDYISSLFS